MAIVRLSKTTLYGAAADKPHVLERLQELGCLHLVNLRPEGATREPLSDVALLAHEALKYLRACPLQRPPAEREQGFDFEWVVREAVAVQNRDRDLQDEKDDLQKAIELQRPWGEFDLPPPEALGGVALWFYVVPADKVKRLDRLDRPWQIVAHGDRREYVVVASETEPHGVPGVRVELDPRPISQLEERVARIDLECEELQLRRAGLTRWIGLIERRLARAENASSLRHAMQHTYDDEAIFALQGWTPESSVAAVEALARENNLALTVEPATLQDAPPTLLKNPEFLAGGEQAVTFYVTPSYHSWDPSLIVLFSFATFFAMIFADAGYAMILGVVLAGAWGRLSRTVESRRLRNMALLIVSFSVVYGVLVGSYFGVSPHPRTLLGRLKLLDVNDQGVMMPLAILVGAGHLMLANGVTAWRLRDSVACLRPAGWMITIVGGLLAGFGGFGAEKGYPAWMYPAGLWTVGAGLGLVLVFSSERPFPPKGAIDALWRLVDGLKSLTSVSAIFGDVLSYLRLFALGLAGAQLAMTFNRLADGAWKGLGNGGILFAAVILLVGHSLNFVLCIMSGVVHGLRLNCIEFFNWSLSGEGYPFRAFSKKAVD